MRKLSIYLVDELPAGEIGIHEYLSKKGFRIEECDIYRGDAIVGKFTEGTAFSERPDLELHVFDSGLERMVDGLVAKAL